jgi:hypothetical protein
VPTFLGEDTLQKRREYPVQTFSEGKITSGEMLRNRNRFENRKKDFDQEFDWDIVSDMSCVPAAGEKLYEGLFDNLPSARDQVIGERRFFAAQITNEYRLSLSSLPMELDGELMKCADEVTCLFRKNFFQSPFGLVEFLGENAFDQNGFAGEMGVKGLFAHPDFGSEFVHGHVSESVSHEMLASAGKDPLGDRIQGLLLQLVAMSWVGNEAVHTLRKPYWFF